MDFKYVENFHRVLHVCWSVSLHQIVCDNLGMLKKCGECDNTMYRCKLNFTQFNFWVFPDELLLKNFQTTHAYSNFTTHFELKMGHYAKCLKSSPTSLNHEVSIALPVNNS
jgi:hypothetical protein